MYYNLSGIEIIANERKRHTEVEGWTPEHDTQHKMGELANAAACYAIPENDRYILSETDAMAYLWPFESAWWKPTPDDRIKELAKAGALIAAEIDRLLALETNK